MPKLGDARRLPDIAEGILRHNSVLGLAQDEADARLALLELQKSGIHVASYWTEGLPKKERERSLHEAVRLARVRLEPAKA